VAVSTVFLSHRGGEKHDADALTEQLQGRRVTGGDRRPSASESWRRQVISYGNVAASRWTVINAFEVCLPASPLCAEWQALQQRDYRSFTTNETAIPVAFVALYRVAIAAGILLLAGVG
jgi:hypothetical protein